MNFGNFTTKAQEAFQRAHAIASERGGEHIGTLHLLMALIEQEEGVVPVVLKKIEIDIDLLYDKIDQEMEKLPKVLGGGIGQAFLGQDLALVVERARKEAKSFKHEYISTEHWLMGLLDVSSSAKKTLQDV